MPVFEKCGERFHAVESLFHTGQVQKRIERYADAKKDFEETLKTYREIEYPLGIIRSLLEIGKLYVRTGNKAKAEENYVESLIISEEEEDKDLESLIMRARMPRTRRLKPYSV